MRQRHYLRNETRWCPAMDVTSTGVWDAIPCSLVGKVSEETFTCFFCSEAGGCIFLRNFGACLPNNTLPHPPHEWKSRSLKTRSEMCGNLDCVPDITVQWRCVTHPEFLTGRKARVGSQSHCEQFEEPRGQFYTRIIEEKDGRPQERDDAPVVARTTRSMHSFH